jgi:hypothetical protein
MADIFVSYKREDQAAIEPLVRLLEARGFSVWWDPCIVPGERFASVIRDALNNATCVIVSWSSRSIDSFWVQDEASVARDRGILIPISIDGAQPPLGFRQLQTTNLADWHGQADDPRIEYLLAGISRIMGKPNQSDSTIAHTAEPYRNPIAQLRRRAPTFPIRGIGRRWTAPGAGLAREGDIIGLITIMSLAATLILSIFSGFLTEYFDASLLAPLGEGWRAVLPVPQGLLQIYIWTWSTAAFYLTGIVCAFAIRNTRIKRCEWFDLNSSIPRRPIERYFLPVLLGGTSGCIVLILVAFSGGPGFRRGPNAFLEIIEDLGVAIRQTLPWLPLSFVATFVAVWLGDASVVGIGHNRLTKIVGHGIAGGLLVGLVGLITSHIPISTGIRHFGIAHGLTVSDQIVQAANYLSLYMSFMITLFVSAMFTVVQASILLVDRSRCLADNYFKASSTRSPIFIIFLDHTGQAFMFAADVKQSFDAKPICNGEWMQFPEGTVVQWVDMKIDHSKCGGDRALITWHEQRLIYRGYDGRISTAPQIVARLEVLHNPANELRHKAH